MALEVAGAVRVLPITIMRKVSSQTIILDLSKTLNSVNHRKILFHLLNYGVDSQIIIMSWIECFFLMSQSGSPYGWNHFQSLWCAFGSGSVLGALLFLL